MGMGTLCTAKKAPMYEHGDTLHCQKGPYIWAWGHFDITNSHPPNRFVWLNHPWDCIIMEKLFLFGYLCTGERQERTMKVSRCHVVRTLSIITQVLS